jgi:hypothetical protein
MFGSGSGSGDLGWLAERCLDHRGPDEPGELARDRGRRDGRALAVGGQRAVTSEQAGLGLPGAGGDLGRDLVGELGGAGGLAGAVLVIPGRFDQQPPGVRVAGLTSADTAAPGWA